MTRGRNQSHRWPVAGTMRTRAQLNQTVDRGLPQPVLAFSAAVLWIAIAGVLLLALSDGAWTSATAAAGCLLLALGPLGFTGLSGISFPEGLPTGILVYTAAAFLAGEIGGFYVTIWWWDIALHLVASAVLSLVGMALALMATGGARPHVALWVLAVLAFGFSMMVGAMWELMEFSLDAVFGTNTQRSGLPDTMGDMAANLVGGALGACVAHDTIGRGARWPLGGLLRRFLDLNPKLYPSWPRGRPARR
jgi:hypothetical protein